MRNASSLGLPLTLGQLPACRNFMSTKLLREDSAAQAVPDPAVLPPCPNAYAEPEERRYLYLRTFAAAAPSKTAFVKLYTQPCRD